MAHRILRVTLVLLALTTLTVLLPSRVALACTCIRLPPGDPIDLAGRHSDFYDHAFIGTIERIEDAVEADPRSEGYAAGSYVPYVLDVEVHLAGDGDPEKVILLQHSRPEPGELAPDCSYGFARGHRYLVEAHENPDGTFLTNGCSFNQPYGTGPPDGEAAPEPGRLPPPAAETDPSGSAGTLPFAIAVGALAVAGAVIVGLTFRHRSSGAPPGETRAE